MIALDDKTIISLTGDLADQREFSLALKANIQYRKFQTRRSMNIDQTA